MAIPVDEPLDLPKRSPGALWGAAHLAWGMAILLGLLYAAWRLPVDSTPWLERLGLALFFTALVWMALSGWRNIERGWRLRRPTTFAERQPIAEMLIDLLVGVALLGSLMRGSDSRVLAAGLDRLVSAIITISVISVLLWVIDLASSHAENEKQSDVPERRLRWMRLAIAGVMVGLILAMELLPW